MSDDADKNTVLHKVYFNKLEDGQNQTPLLGSPDIIVDRGHAGTSGLALGNIKLNTKLIVFGSCGGHGNISEALESNSRLQVIGTTATGSMMVNDPLFWSIIHDGIKKKRIDRVEREPSETFINMLDETGKKSYDYNRERYILPHENLQQLFAEKYKSLIDPASSGNMPEGEG